MTPSPSQSAIPDDSDLADRETTPTPRRISADRSANQLANESRIDAASSRSNEPSDPTRPRRRSSLSRGTSPMTAIKSPTRTAEAAAQLQHHLTLTSPRHPRTDVLGGVLYNIDPKGDGFDVQVAINGTRLVGRMRTGSVGGGVTARTLGSQFPPVKSGNGTSTGATRPHRHIRRTLSTGFPILPPPNAPLPALPPVPPVPGHFRQADSKPPAKSIRGRDRAIDKTYI